MKGILTKISNLIKRAVVTLNNNDSKGIAYCQVSYLGKTVNMETIYPYGYSAKAPVGSIALAFNVGSNEANLAGTPYSQKNRFKNLKDGEVVSGNELTGSYIKFTEDKNVNIYSSGKIILSSKSDFNYGCEGNYVLNISGSFSLNSNTFGFFGQTPVAKQVGGASTAGGTYTSNEQQMLNKIYTALQNYGLLS